MFFFCSAVFCNGILGTMCLHSPYSLFVEMYGEIKKEMDGFGEFFNDMHAIR